MKQNSFSPDLPAPKDSLLIFSLIAMALSTAIINQYISQAAMLTAICLCIPLLMQRRQGAPPVPAVWVFALAFVSLAAIPMSLLSESARPLDAPLRYTVLIIPLLTLYRYELPILPLLRCLSSAPLIAAVLVLGLDLYPETRFKLIDETRYDFGLGLLDSAFAAVLLLPMIVAQFTLDRGKLAWQLLSVLGICAVFVIIVKSGTRTSWLALVSVPIIAQLLLARGSPRLLLAAVATVGLVIVISYLAAPIIKERVDAATSNVQQYLDGDSVNQKNSLGLRFDLWKVAIETFKRSPVLGTSYQERSAIKKEMIDAGRVTEHIGTDGRGSAHNEVLNALSKKGLLGFAAILLLYFVPLRYFRKCCKLNGDRLQRNISAAAASSVLMAAICGFAEAPLMSGRFSILYGFLLVVMYALVEQRGRKVD